MTRPAPRRPCGYTLLECLVALALGSAILVVGLQLYVQTRRVMDRQQVRAARLGSEADLLSLLRRDVRAAAYLAPESGVSRLVVVSRKGRRIEYRTTPEGVLRVASPDAPAIAQQALPVHVRFEYPAGRQADLVRVQWGSGPQLRSLTLHLRNCRT